MKVKFTGAALALGLMMLPVASFAGGVGGGNANSNWTIYGWQNWSLDFRSHDTARGERDVIQMNNEAANIGFSASIDTGVSVAGTPLKANFRCEQFTLWNRLSNFNHSTWCNRNSKLGLSGPWGEVMFSSWLTPYNELTAQWIDPFYDAGSHTHSTLLGLMGWGPNYNNTGFDFGGYGGGVGGQGFMRRKDNLWQWFSPNWGGLQMRVGWSNNSRWSSDESVVTDSLGNEHEIDPQILSVGIAYTTTINETDELWVAIGYQEHDEFAAAELSCADSDDQTVRYATRYIHDWGNGHSTRISLAYEEMEFDWEHCASGGAGPYAVALTGGMVDLEREAWLISGKHDFPGPWDFRFMYQEADDYDCGASMMNLGADGMTPNNCGAISENSSSAEAISLGLYYTMPAGTELRIVWGEVDNDRNSKNGFGIGSEGVVAGGKEESFQFGMVQWF
jgi:hypothetical protein